MKETRFAALIVPSVVAGAVAARFAGFIRGVFFVGLVLAVGYMAMAWVWSVV